ncbi:glycosyltransferase family 2 protein [Mesorhizobium sp. YIM 152430]|uniref:glycosyltransferase family 2 protein n=1 Tax=Mesorhizobium sp. YIM 152430 TaxID=3031761 RepID=UPI0023DA78F3|nr:glycosyltransferase family 2 protein [Mesorhizobium sp. YIM 152430]MDF1600800.1 glycosyltransferase family 2 protein [Mesorhizobium sp. YIM 152430]
MKPLRHNEPVAADVCVIIAAMDAAATIGRAVSSALNEPRVKEIVIVDDGSRDDATVRAAQAADDGTGRVSVVQLDENRGPAHARNVAIARSKAPFLAILDADDFFVSGRFDAMIDGEDWDFVADNIVFVDERQAGRLPEIPAFHAEPSFVSFREFVDGNISRKGTERGEIGFLKPVMRRSFLDRHGLRYDESLRLGEDFDLYARALALGARYKVVRHCGYGAVVRAGSLSGRHRTLDLKHLYEADRGILASIRLDATDERALRRHEHHIRGRYELRNFLDRKAQAGPLRAGLELLAQPSALPAVVSGIASDKWQAVRSREILRVHSQVQQPRFLLQARKVSQK